MGSPNRLFSVTFSNVASTAVSKDLFYIVPSTKSRLKLSLCAVYKTTQGSTEGVAIDIYRGSSLASAGGTTLSVVALDTRTSATATFSGLLNSSSPGSSGALAKRIYSGVLNDSAPFVYEPAHHDNLDERPVIGGPTLAAQETLQVRMGASGAAMSVSGTLILEEIGNTGG